MLVITSKAKGIIISRSEVLLFPDLSIDGTAAVMVSELKILRVILDSKSTFEKQVRADAFL